MYIKSNIFVDIKSMVISSVDNKRRLRICVVRSAQCLLSLISKKCEQIPTNELHCPNIEIPVSITLQNIFKSFSLSVWCELYFQKVKTGNEVVT